VRNLRVWVFCGSCQRRVSLHPQREAVHHLCRDFWPCSGLCRNLRNCIMVKLAPQAWNLACQRSGMVCACPPQTCRSQLCSRSVLLTAASSLSLGISTHIRLSAQVSWLKPSVIQLQQWDAGLTKGFGTPRDPPAGLLKCIAEVRCAAVHYHWSGAPCQLQGDEALLQALFHLRGACS